MNYIQYTFAYSQLQLLTTMQCNMFAVNIF